MKGSKSTLPHKIALASLRPAISQLILERHPELTESSEVPADWVNDARMDYVRSLLTEQLGELSNLDEEVIESLRGHEVVSSAPDEEDEHEALTFGERLSDKIAEFGGSWGFILSFGAFMAVWIGVNVVVFSNRGFDPYPFILLNLMLSCLAALQAPIIMMSQNRQEVRDRRRAESDYKVNLKAELEIRHLHEKVDYLLHQHAKRLFEIQQIQLEVMREAARKNEEKHR